LASILSVGQRGRLSDAFDEEALSLGVGKFAEVRDPLAYLRKPARNRRDASR
jgi:hypothetical protein